MGGGSSKSSRGASPQLKILLLGGANVGKSTIFKQMRILYKQGFEAKDRQWARGCIIENVLETLVDLDKATDGYQVEMLEENTDIVDDIKPLLAKIKSRKPNEPLPDITVWDSVERLWSDPGIQAVYQEIQHPTQKQDGWDRALAVSSGYFLRQLDSIKRNDYIPTDSDILHLRRSTSDSDSIEFNMDVDSLIGQKTNLGIKCIDVGGQIHERTEWGHHANDLSAILYVLSLSEYSNVGLNGTNILQEQLNLLKTVVETGEFAGVTIIVLLNKVDLLETKLKGIRVNEYFEDYEGNNERQSVVDFFKGKVCDAMGKNPSDSLQMANIIDICATDSQLMRVIIDRIGQSVLQKTLSESKFFG